jgi:hypothetical protein
MFHYWFILKALSIEDVVNEYYNSTNIELEYIFTRDIRPCYIDVLDDIFFESEHHVNYSGMKFQYIDNEIKQVHHFDDSIQVDGDNFNFTLGILYVQFTNQHTLFMYIDKVEGSNDYNIYIFDDLRRLENNGYNIEFNMNDQTFVNDHIHVIRDQMMDNISLTKHIQLTDVEDGNMLNKCMNIIMKSITNQKVHNRRGLYNLFGGYKLGLILFFFLIIVIIVIIVIRQQKISLFNSNR